MNFIQTGLSGSYIVECDPRHDDRGWFVRTYCSEEFRNIGHTAEWVQMNHTYTSLKGTIRGMHFQKPPSNEIKLVRCIRGRVFDVIVDFRTGSPTLLKWFGTVLSEREKNMIYIPSGFAHGFQTLTDDCELIYHHSSLYKPELEDGILYNDPAINITWPLVVSRISERDLNHTPIIKRFNPQ